GLVRGCRGKPVHGRGDRDLHSRTPRRLRRSVGGLAARITKDTKEGEGHEGATKENEHAEKRRDEKAGPNVGSMLLRILRPPSYPSRGVPFHRRRPTGQARRL